MKRKINCGELSVEKTLLGMPHIVKATSETWPNPHVKVNSTLAWSFDLDFSIRRVRTHSYILFVNVKKLDFVFPTWTFINCQDEWK